MPNRGAGWGCDGMPNRGAGWGCDGMPRGRGRDARSAGVWFEVWFEVRRGAHRQPRDGRHAVGRGELDQATVRHVVARAHVAQGEQHKARVAVHTNVAGAAAPG